MPRDPRARNEALFRQVNEQIEAVSKSAPLEEEPIGFLCECDNRDCAEKVDATLAEYEGVRAQATHFIVLPGHEDPAVERVVSQNERFLVTEKEGRAGQDAVETDPRNS